MNPRNTAILFVVAGALFAFIFFYERKLQRVNPEACKVMPYFRPSEVSSIRVALPDQLEIIVERTNGEWQITKPIFYPAQSGIITNLLFTLSELTPALRLSSADLRGHPDATHEYGLDHPQATVIFEQGNQSRQLIFGSLTAPGDQIYVEVVGADGVNILDTNFFKSFIPRSLNDWRHPALLKSLNLDFNGISVSGGQQPLISFYVSRDAANLPWRMVKPVDTRADNPRINTLLAQLGGVRIAGFISDSLSADLDAYGLHPPLAALNFLHGTNKTFTIQFGNNSTNDTNLIFAKIEGRPAIITIPRDAITPWLAGFQEFRERHLIRLQNLKPDSITIEGEENVVLQRQTDGGWKASLANSREGIKADPDTMDDFIRSLTNMQVTVMNHEVAVKDTVPPDAASLDAYGLAKPAHRYILRADKSSLPEGVTNDVIAAVDFGSVKEGITYARRSDMPSETSVYAVATTNIMRLPTRLLQFQKRRIWEFTENEVASISIRHRNGIEKLARKGAAKWIVMEGSHGAINDLELEFGAQELGSLEAYDWIQSGDANASQFGFGTNTLQFTVELNTSAGTTQVRTLEIGSWSQTGLHYASTSLADGQKWIFTLPAKTYERLVAYFNLRDDTAR
jgi:hypothetical protein